MFEVLFTLLDVDLKDEKYNLDKRSDEIIKRFDLSGDRKLSREEFVNGVKDDEPLKNLLLNHKFEWLMNLFKQIWKNIQKIW